MTEINHITRRKFLKKGINLGVGCSVISGLPFSLFPSNEISTSAKQKTIYIKIGERQLFADGLMVDRIQGIQRKTHSAMKLDYPVLEADMPWEQGEEYNGRKDRRVYVYGTVIRNENTGKFQMWYNRLRTNYYAISNDGIHWKRPNLGQLGEDNRIQLFDFHSPSIILDKFETDPEKKYKAIGSVKGGISKEKISLLKEKHRSFSWYNKSSAYSAAYSADGLNWKRYLHPIIIGADTITFAQDPVTGEYMAFHKNKAGANDKGRKVFLSTSTDMQNWTEPKLVMAADETDHMEARKLKGGTHSEFYNMSAFPYANQWLGMVTHFRRTGEPLVKGPGQSNSEGPIDVQLVHSRDGRNWERCSDRSPVIPLGPYYYDSGSILGICNFPVIVGDEMWMYYTAMTTTHGGYLPDKEMSIARASWRIDGLVSVQAGESEGLIETVPLMPDGNKLYVNVNATEGKLLVEVVDLNRGVVPGYERSKCNGIQSDSVKQLVRWNSSEKLPEGKPICLRFFLTNGNLFSYLIE
jgi:hypothetical protein